MGKIIGRIRTRRRRALERETLAYAQELNRIADSKPFDHEARSRATAAGWLLHIVRRLNR